MEESLKDKLWREFNSLSTEPKLLSVAIKLPTGAIETITNTSNITEKVHYYMNSYDYDFRLNANPAVQIVGYMIV
jgi:hypothetical protein